MAGRARQATRNAAPRGSYGDRFHAIAEYRRRDAPGRRGPPSHAESVTCACTRASGNSENLEQQCGQCRETRDLWGQVADKFGNRKLEIHMCGVEVWRGGLGGAYRLPTLSSVGASLAPPCIRFHTPLIEPDVLYKGMSREHFSPSARCRSFFVSAFSPRLNVHSHSESGLAQAYGPVSFPCVKRRNASSSLWFHVLVAAAPFVF